jgi:hypothetical protein
MTQTGGIDIAGQPGAADPPNQTSAGSSLFIKVPFRSLVLSRDGVTTDGVWIGNRIYWTLWYSAWLHFIVHCYTHIPVSTVTFSVAVAWQRLSTADVPLPLWIPELTRSQLPASNSNSSQRLNRNNPDSELLYDWRFTSISVRLGAKPIEDQDQFFFFCNWTLSVIVLM